MDEKKRVSRLSSGLHSAGNNARVTGSEKASERELAVERITRNRDMSKVTVIPPRAENNLNDPFGRKRVVAYCRVSTDGLSQKTSFELQKTYYIKYIRRRPDWKLVAMYSDEGLTATKIDKRVGLLTMLDDAKAGKFDIIVVKNLSRLSRNLMDCMAIIYELRVLSHPVGILFETENLFTLDKNMDFTLQVLSLVAQEESHKKSEAMNASYQQRFSQGYYTKPDLLGYDRVGVNEIAINEEEAATVQLIYMMYLAGVSLDDIARVLNDLKRKNHTRQYKDGSIKEGTVNWSSCSVRNVLTNEKRCGDVLAQKTYTPNFLDHVSKPNLGNLPQYYARDQHPAIVAPEDFRLANRLLAANRGGWQGVPPKLGVFIGGPLTGFVRTVPNWKGFDIEDYYRAGLRASGLGEEKLAEIEARIESSDGEIEQESDESPPSPQFIHQYALDSDDYDLFPEENTAEYAETDTVEKASFAKEAEKYRLASTTEIPHDEVGGYDYSSAEVIRGELFSTWDKASCTINRRGVSFNKRCLNKLIEGAGIRDHIKVDFDPIRRIVLISPSATASDATLNWIRRDEQTEKISMRQCVCVGLAKAIFEGMGWNEDYKYRILGSIIKEGRDRALMFYLEDAVMIVPARSGSARNLDTDTELHGRKSKKKIIRDALSVGRSYMPNLDEFELGDGPMASAAKRMSRSRAIYYDELTEKTDGTLTLEDMGDKRYDPEYIRRMIEKDIAPVEGWDYLRGVAAIKRNSFTIYPTEWVGVFGKNLYCNNSVRWNHHRSNARPQNKKSEPIPYGWTVGLDLPTMDTVNDAIRYLRERPC